MSRQTVVVVVGAVVVGAVVVLVVVVGRVVVVVGAGGRRVVVVGRGRVVVLATVVGVTLVGIGGAGAGVSDVVSSQDGTGNGTLLVSGINDVSMVVGCTCGSHEAAPSSANAATAAAATPAVERAKLCTPGASVSAAMMETLCNRADAIRCHPAG